jgi:hypothetical protein
MTPVAGSSRTRVGHPMLVGQSLDILHRTVSPANAGVELQSHEQDSTESVGISTGATNDGTSAPESVDDSHYELAEDGL